ncbi:MAG: iron-only hydrogenase system regulator [Clostridia bacterium]|jgi:putative iron-only hydrogenase system regulator|nr:iron-only hydrogenase system regulator [Clostridia bacterium]
MAGKRLGVVGIVLEDSALAKEVNEILHRYAHIISGRMGLPYKERNVSVISLIVDGTTDEISALTGSLGKLHGVSVKSALTKE